MPLTDNFFNFIFPCRLLCNDDCSRTKNLVGEVTSENTHNTGLDNVDPIEVVKRNLKNFKEQGGVVKETILGDLLPVEKNKHLDLGIQRYLDNMSGDSFQNLSTEDAKSFVTMGLQMMKDFKRVVRQVGFSDEHYKQVWGELKPFTNDKFFSKLPEDLKKQMGD